jgi:hypothetical protein
MEQIMLSQNYFSKVRKNRITLNGFFRKSYTMPFLDGKDIENMKSKSTYESWVYVEGTNKTFPYSRENVSRAIVRHPGSQLYYVQQSGDTKIVTPIRFM